MIGMIINKFLCRSYGIEPGFIRERGYVHNLDGSERSRLHTEAWAFSGKGLADIGLRSL